MNRSTTPSPDAQRYRRTHTMTDESALPSLAAQANSLRSGDVSTQEILDVYLERIQRLNPRLNAFRTVRADAARAEAAAARALRIAVSFKNTLPGIELEAQRRTAVERTAHLLTELGHDVLERDPRYGQLLPEIMPTT